jgi:F0F1-type ATP synthase membrane subunit b/b'
MSVIDNIKANKVYQDSISRLTEEERHLVEENSKAIAAEYEKIIEQFCAKISTQEGLDEIIQSIDDILAGKGTEAWHEKL